MLLKQMKVEKLIEQTRRKDANPGGGAILILCSNLAINLIMMMIKKDVSHETLLALSEELTDLMQDDVDNFNLLMEDYYQDKLSEESYLRASESLLRMVEINLEALESLKFYIDNSRLAALSDGQIANDLLKECIFASLPTIELNLRTTRENIDYESIRDKVMNLYINNQKLIERRKQ